MIPTKRPTTLPTMIPTKRPTTIPTNSPTKPTMIPTMIPTRIPTMIPTKRPTTSPTILPTRIPTAPSRIPSVRPSRKPSTVRPSSPTVIPTTTKPYTAHFVVNGTRATRIEVGFASVSMTDFVMVTTISKSFTKPHAIMGIPTAGTPAINGGYQS
eukprot:gene15743-21319_t